MNLLAEWKRKSSRSPTTAAAASSHLVIPMLAPLTGAALRARPQWPAAGGDEEDEGADERKQGEVCVGRAGGTRKALAESTSLAAESFPPTARARKKKTTARARAGAGGRRALYAQQ